MSSHDDSPPVLPSHGACSLPVLTCSIISICSYFAFAVSSKAIIENAEKILSKAEVWQSHNRDDLRNGKRYFGDSKKLTDSSGSVLDADLCAEGVYFVFEFHRTVLPKFEKFSKLFLGVSQKRCEKITNACLLTQVKKRDSFF